jgi:hypothetical protein
MTTLPFDIDCIKELAKKLGGTLASLRVLAPQNDPFTITPSRRADAEWFAGLGKRFGVKTGGHARGLHYRIVMSARPAQMRNSMPYLNTTTCWQALLKAGRDARYLDLVAVDDVVDRRNAAAIVNARPTSESPFAFVPGGSTDLEELQPMPEPPRAVLRVGERTQRYRLEIWIEKSTMNGILEPICRRYNITLVPGTGETSATRCNEAIDRAEADGRPTIILYISDFDPAGLSMPVAAARKIEYFLRKRGLDHLEIQLIPIALTLDQCVKYRLPRTPLKDTELRTEAFEERFGEGATELDALEAGYPGELARIVEREIICFYDKSLDRKTEEAAGPVEENLDRVTEAIHKKHRKQIDALSREYEAIAVALAAWQEHAEPVWDAIREEIEAEIEPIMDVVEWPEAKEPREYQNPLFGSTRDYVEQIEHYKKFQGKPNGGARDDEW